MLLIGLRRSGSVCLLLFTLTLFANFASTAPMSFRWLLRKSCLPGFSFVSLPSFRRAGCLWKVSGYNWCFPRVFLSFRSTWSSGRGGGASGRAFGARKLASVSSVHSWTGDTGVALLWRTPATFYVRLVLPPHLCTFDEVMGWVSQSERFLAMFSVVSPASSLHARRGGEAGEIFECSSC